MGAGRCAGVVVVALARQVGTLHLRLGPLRRPRDRQRGAAARRGAAATTRPILEGGGRAMLGGPADAAGSRCSLPDLRDLQEVAPGLPAVARPEGWPRSWCTTPAPKRRWNVPGTPFAVVMDRHGVVRAKGTVNNLEQLEGLVDTAARRWRTRSASDLAPGGDVDPPVRTAWRGRSSAWRSAHAPWRSWAGSAGVWSPSPAGGFAAARCDPIAPRPTTSAGTPSPPAPARIPTRRSSRTDRYGLPGAPDLRLSRRRQRRPVQRQGRRPAARPASRSCRRSTDS